MVFLRKNEENYRMGTGNMKADLYLYALSLERLICPSFRAKDFWCPECGFKRRIALGTSKVLILECLACGKINAYHLEDK